MPQIIMQIGLPASGKTHTRAAIVAANPDVIVISSDDVIDEIAQRTGLTYQDAYVKHAADVKEQIYALAIDMISQGRDIIWDQTNLTVENRAAILALVPEHYSRVALVCEVDDLTLAQRFKDREARTGKSIPDEILAKMKSAYIAPTLGEGFTHIVAASDIASLQ